MGKSLNTHVHVSDEHGTPHVFGPDDQLPDWAVEKIANPKVWDDDGGVQAAQTGQAEGPAAPPATPDQPDDAGGESGGGDRGELPEPPPRSGSGSGAAAWHRYAAAAGVPVGEDAGRDDVIAALEAAGVPVGPGQ